MTEYSVPRLSALASLIAGGLCVVLTATSAAGLGIGAVAVGAMGLGLYAGRDGPVVLGTVGLLGLLAVGAVLGVGIEFVLVAAAAIAIAYDRAHTAIGLGYDAGLDVPTRTVEIVGLSYALGVVTAVIGGGYVLFRSVPRQPSPSAMVVILVGFLALTYVVGSR
ncbi:DUF7519 family protein [Halopiger aswanensis]|uniref:Uncharacterized protein n=1 Tax=Halopiger aswanensis TaxID=148449 RepID=A0A419WIE4_9EURY|nr:hypothetical protein [Halopiger aswanensis]RKD95229.1 hypothetical protein ATJ93_2081 [Halopiger aswanensis]